jgi:hypothetical protein
MPSLSRRRNTPAISGRSRATPVSFSTIEASVSSLSGVSMLGSGARLAHALASASSIASAARSRMSRSVVPRVNR